MAELEWEPHLLEHRLTLQSDQRIIHDPNGGEREEGGGGLQEN